MRQKFQGATSRHLGRVVRVAFFPMLVVLTALLLVPASSPVTGSEKITTIAGTGRSGLSGDGGLATEAQLYYAQGLAVDGADNLYIADGFRIRMIQAGIITTVAGTGIAGYSGDGGPATDAMLKHPKGLAVDDAGNLYIADNDNHRVRMVDKNRIITTVVGTGVQGFSGDGGPATEARLTRPSGLAIDSAGSLYIADTGNHRVRRVDSGGIITTIVGTGIEGFSGDGGPAKEARLSEPIALAIDSESSLYIADRKMNRVRRVNNGIITRVAGGGTHSPGDGGPATEATVGDPYGLAVDRGDNLYIAERASHRVRRVDTKSIITTVAGTGRWMGGGDGGPAAEAGLDGGPLDLAFDSGDNLYIADAQVIRKIWAGIPGNRAPVAVFTSSTTSGRVPLAVSFNAADSYDPDGGIVSYRWDFGDGTSGKGKTVKHTYTSAGRHTVSLTVADSFGRTDTASTVITASPRFCKGRQATIVGTAGRDFIYGTPGSDVIVTLTGSDEVRAGAGDDYVCLGPGNDRAIGGRGNDRIYGQGGNDRIDGKGGIDHLHGGIGADSLRGAGGIDQLLGGSGPDVLRGGAGADVLRGNAGADRLFGGRGDDRLIGGKGFDRGDGGPGRDICRTEQRTNCP